MQNHWLILTHDKVSVSVSFRETAFCAALQDPSRALQNVLLDQSSAPTASRDKQELETTTKHMVLFFGLMISRWK